MAMMGTVEWFSKVKWVCDLYWLGRSASGDDRGTANKK
jgi:hypothetical protein